MPGRGLVMARQDVIDPSTALLHLTDCTLATVILLTEKESSSKTERSRQIQMAQTAIGWLEQFGIDYSGTRVASVKVSGGSVEQWAEQFRD